MSVDFSPNRLEEGETKARRVALWSTGHRIQSHLIWSLIPRNILLT